LKKAFSEREYVVAEEIGEEQTRRTHEEKGKRIRAEKEKEEERKAKEAAEKEKEEERKAKEAAEKKAKENEEKRIQAEKRLAEEGDQDFYGIDLPALNHTEKTTLTHVNKAHTAASVRNREAEFKKLYEGIHQTYPGTCQPIMRTWFLLKKDDQGVVQRLPLEFANESVLVTRIFQYLEVALGATGLKEKLELQSEYFVYSIRPDIMLLLKKQDGRCILLILSFCHVLSFFPPYEKSYLSCAHWGS